MKKQILLILCSILALNAGAERISRDEALALAQGFMQGKVMVPVQASSSKAPLRGVSNDESYYIFNAADNGGYAIIAADDRLSPVLGFSDLGNISLDNMPENMASWLEYYKYEISNLKSGDVEAFIDAPVSRSEVKPLLNCLWGQFAPYNLLCPVYDGTRSPVGCVAVAMAQIMYYYKWPVGVVDSIPPYINMCNSQLVEGQPATTFKWDLINPSYSSDETDENAYAVAELLRYCGQAVDMGYETDASGAYSSNVPKALIERFNYSRQTELVNKCDFSSYDWDEMIYNELASGRPVCYGGNRTLDGGHAFVCDGYKDGYFHINWGQGTGYYDGYFKLSLLSMEEPGLNNQYNYGYLQDAIIGIEPEMNSLIGTTITDEKFKYTILSDTTAMIQAIDAKDYNGTDTLWIPDHVDYNGNRYFVTRLSESENLNYNFKKVYLPSSLKQIDCGASFLQTISEFTIPSSIEVLSSTAFKKNKSLERFIAEEGYSRYKVIDGVLFSYDGKELMCYPQGRKDTCYTVPDGVETIGGLSFCNNHNLLEIILPDCVEHINDLAFYGCFYLKRIKMPENLKDIGYSAFWRCSDLNNVILPPKTGTIVENAFESCTSLKSIIIPNSLSYCLAVGTFKDCSSLENVYIPSGIKKIRSDCFKGCTALKEIVVESVVPPAFESYSVFDETVYENAVLKVPAGKIDLFRNAEIWSGFKHISAIPSDTIDGINYDLSESAKIAVVVPGKEPYAGNIVIPATVEYNGLEYAVNALQPAVFAGCKDLTSVVIDAPVSVLPDSLFKDCSSLKSIKLNDGLLKIGHYVFYGCSALEAIDIPQGVSSIGESLFRGCESLRSVTFPESVRLLGPFAFVNCSNLDSVTFCGYMHQIDSYVFYGCTNLTYVSLPKNLSRIKYGAFWECSKLQTITIPESVTTIEDRVFYKCISLTSINLPEGLSSIGSYTFCDCQSLESITIPESITTINDHAFTGCQSLKSVILPDGVKFIGNNAFLLCSNLDSIVIPQGMEKIEKATFDRCYNLKSVILPESITELDTYAFIECYSLSTITIPANVRKIGNRVFEDCRNLTSFYCCVEDPQEIEMGNDIFTRINEDCILYVPEGCVQAYRDDERWSAFSDIREMGGVTQVEPVSRQAAVPVEYYNLSGGKQPGLQNGINIIRYNDGTVRKVTQ